MKWTECIKKFQTDAELHPPSSEAAIFDSETKLGVRFPAGLRSLLLESDGVEVSFGSSLIWSTGEIARHNLEFRGSKDFAELYMPFDHLLFFGDAGNGDQFAFSILAGKVRSETVFAWNHEEDSRTWAAPNLEVFIEWWFTDRIRI